MNGNSDNIDTAVILAGGLGTRLRPYTVSLPKPLMPVGEHPILEIVIRQLAAAGISRVIIAVGYLESLIRAYFGDGSRFGVEIVYAPEAEPLGTAGPLRALRGQLDRPFVFMNGDVFTDIDLHGMMGFHFERGCMATVAVASRQVDIDFGVVEMGEGASLAGWSEKPTLGYCVSMGIYVLDPVVIDHLPAGFSNIPDLVTGLARDGAAVHCYEHAGYWLDIGRPEDYQQACQDVAEQGIDRWLKPS